MITSIITERLDYKIHDVYRVVLNVNEYDKWRSDLSKVKILNKTQFVEYTKENYATTFTITRTDPLTCWEFDIDNINMSGHWSGVFKPCGNQTEIIFTEQVHVKKRLMKLFARFYLKKQQIQFVKDLKKYLESIYRER